MTQGRLVIRMLIREPEIAEIRPLFREYADSLEVDLGFQNFEEELAGLPGDYWPPDGRLFLAEVDGRSAGCVALRSLEGRSLGEMKRLYVRPEFRGSGVARALVQALLEEARRMEYASVRLDTLPSMVGARKLYESLGFVSIAPYRSYPIAGVTFWEIDLIHPRIAR